MNEAKHDNLLETERRAGLRQLVRTYAAAHDLVPPLSFVELQNHAANVLPAADVDGDAAQLVAVLLNNEAWTETLAAVPFERRLLLLPQCLRTKQDCPAEIDQFGLLCQQCGRCPTGALQQEAEELGYVVLVAEGTTMVTALLEQGKVDAVVGASCVAALEKSFPAVLADAVPSIAVPLLSDGCDGTQVDLAWVREALHLRSGSLWTGRVSIDDLRATVDNWFRADRLRKLIGGNGTATEAAGVDWLAKAGKRWRPVLAVAVYRALTGRDPDDDDACMRHIAVATECFHKASLIHDDIEDGDDVRYGEETLHAKYGVPFALNVGDFLLGEGYRLLSECGALEGQRVRMLAVAANAHRSLCLGQGEELTWLGGTCPLPSEKVIDIFRHKTAPAFEVALRLGAIRAGGDTETCAVLKSYSEALGVAFQINDDLADLSLPERPLDFDLLRPSLPLAILRESGPRPLRPKIAEAWRRAEHDASFLTELNSALRRDPVAGRVTEMRDRFRDQAIQALGPLRNASLKSLLVRLVRGILDRA